MDYHYLAETWARHAGDGDAARAAFERLLARYSEPHRRYHTVQHLTAVWRAIDESLASQPDDTLDVPAIYLAAAYHDAVYAPTAPDNEERSAELAARELNGLGHDEGRIARARQMILDTKTHTPTSPESVELVDADMAILAADRGTYTRYAAATRAEYAVFDDEQWVAGRPAVLRRMLAAPIFRPGSPREAAARANIAYELEHLANGKILG